MKREKVKAAKHDGGDNKKHEVNLAFYSVAWFLRVYRPSHFTVLSTGFHVVLSKCGKRMLRLDNKLITFQSWEYKKLLMCDAT